MTTERSDLGRQLARGVIRLMNDMGFEALTEIRLNPSRRVDVMAVNAKGVIAVIEVKTSLNDFRADRKWPEYLDFCDHFYFAVPEDFPADHLPAEHGLIIADRFSGVVERPSPYQKMNGTRRRSITLKFGRVAASRLKGYEDPDRI